MINVNKPQDFDPKNREYDPFYDPIAHSMRVLIGFMQGLFAQCESGKYRWSPDVEDTEITITGQYPLTIESLARRPAIVCVNSQAAYLNTSMNNLETIKISTGNKVHRDIISCNAVFNCVSRTGLEASRIAWFVASNIKSLQVFLQRNGPFTRIGHDVTIGGESSPGGILPDVVDGSAINVQVVVPFFIPHKWEVRNPSYKNDDIQLKVDAVTKQNYKGD